MAIFGHIGKKISIVSQGAVQQAKNLVEVNRLNSLIADNENRIEVLFSMIGQEYYKRHIDDPESMEKARIDEIKACYEQNAEFEEQIKEIKLSASCPKCGAKLPTTARFCSNCGYNMDDMAKETCPSCGARIDEEMQFCISCGVRLSSKDTVFPVKEKGKEEMSPDGERITEKIHENRRCPFCGDEIDESMLFCTSCGNKLKSDQPITETNEDDLPIASGKDTYRYPEVPDDKKEDEICLEDTANQEQEIAVVQEEDIGSEFADEQDTIENQSESEETQSTDAEKVCPVCGMRHDSDTLFCPKCGTKMSEDV